MEKSSRFNLTAAIENWRHELAGQPGLSPEARRELETHLRDTIAELQGRGLNDEESFWLARRRVGQPKQICEEFAKADPARVWRERVFWMAVSLVGSYAFVTWKDLLASWLNQSSWMECFYLVPLCVFGASVIMIRRGRIPDSDCIKNISSWKLNYGLFVILAVTILTAYFRGQSMASDSGGLIAIGYNIGVTLSWFGNAIWPSVLVLVLLFTSRQNRNTSKGV